MYLDRNQYRIIKQKGHLEHNPEEQKSIQNKMKDVQMASERLRKLEMMEKKRV